MNEPLVEVHELRKTFGPLEAVQGIGGLVTNLGLVMRLSSKLRFAYGAQGRPTAVWGNKVSKTSAFPNRVWERESFRLSACVAHVPFFIAPGATQP